MITPSIRAHKEVTCPKCLAGPKFNCFTTGLIKGHTKSEKIEYLDIIHIERLNAWKALSLEDAV